uniref:Uncharacterized protein n=1 Tax=Ditylenchus dipsaci TaxID=166011 RepID=A0A915CSD3_9BILA
MAEIFQEDLISGSASVLFSSLCWRLTLELDPLDILIISGFLVLLGFGRGVILLKMNALAYESGLLIQTLPSGGRRLQIGTALALALFLVVISAVVREPVHTDVLAATFIIFAAFVCVIKATPIKMLQMRSISNTFMR